MLQAGRHRRAQHLEMDERQRVVYFARPIECVLRACQRRERERVALGNRPQLESRFGDYSQRAERSGHHLHQIIAGHVFDDPPAAMHQTSGMPDEADADQKIARRAFGMPERTRVRRADERAERGRIGRARIERQALRMPGQARVERPERHSGLGDHGHVLGLVGHDASHACERDAERCGRAADLTERARRAQRRERDFFRFAMAHDFRKLVGVARLGDDRRHAGLAPPRPSHALGVEQPAQRIFDPVGLRVVHRL